MSYGMLILVDLQPSRIHIVWIFADLRSYLQIRYNPKKKRTSKDIIMDKLLIKRWRS